MRPHPHPTRTPILSCLLAIALVATGAWNLSAQSAWAPVAAPAASLALPALQESPERPQIRKPIEQNEERNGRIAQLVGRILEQIHYIQQPYNEEMSKKHLKNYMEALDYNRMIFLQSDYEEFAKKYGTELAKATSRGDASPAFVIFDRFVTRLEQRKKLVDSLVEEKYDFTVDEKFLPNRDKMPFPTTEADAERLWRGRIKFELLQGRLDKEKDEDTRARVKRRYNSLLKSVREYEESDVLQAYLNALTQSYDPHSDYFTPDDKENFDINAIDLKLTGIGAVLTTQDGYAKIQRLVPGGPAAKSNRLKPGDRIVTVAQGDDGEPVDVVDMKLRKVVDLIRGKQGSKVRLTVIPVDTPDVRNEVVIVRDEIVLTEQHAKARIFEIPKPDGSFDRIGVIELPQFYKETVEHVSALLKRLQEEKIQGLVLDLRKNGGGLLDQAIDLTGLFIKNGPVVQVKNHEGKTTVLETDSNRALYTGPLMVMVGHLSASASEIVAAALQDYDRALVVGDSKTHGKGTVQTLLPLSRWMGFGFRGDPGALKLTVQKFYRVSGGSTQQRGVTPDIQLPSLLDYYEIGEQQLPNHLTYDSVKPGVYTSYGMAKNYIADLKALSDVRVKQSKDFSYVFEDIELLKKRLEDKSISLNESDRIREKSDLLAKREARKKEREARPKEGQNTAYELTVEMVEKKQPLKPVQLVKASATSAEIASAPAKPADGAAVAATNTNPVPEKEAIPAPDEEAPESELSDGDANFDPQLDESLLIMVDYIDLLNRRNTLTTRNP